MHQLCRIKLKTFILKNKTTMQKIYNNMRKARMAIMLILALLTIQTVKAASATVDKTTDTCVVTEAE